MMSQERSARRVLLATPTGKRPRGDHGPGGVTSSPNLLGQLVPSWGGASRTTKNCCWPWGVSSRPGAAAPVILPKGKAGVKMNKLCEVITQVFSTYALKRNRRKQVCSCDGANAGVNFPNELQWNSPFRIWKRIPKIWDFVKIWDFTVEGEAALFFLALDLLHLSTHIAFSEVLLWPLQ